MKAFFIALVYRIFRLPKKVLRVLVRYVSDILINLGTSADLSIVLNVNLLQFVKSIQSSFALISTNDVESSLRQWEAIQKNLDGMVHTIMDIGARKCFFSIKSLEYARYVVAVESDSRICRDVVNILYRENMGNILVMNMLITKDNVLLLPHADVTLFLSVYHQWVVEMGEPAAFDLLSALWDKTKKTMFFSMADGLAKSNRYRPYLSFLGESIEENMNTLETYIGKLPSSAVTHLGYFPYWKGENRHIFKIDRYIC